MEKIFNEIKQKFFENDFKFSDDAFSGAALQMCGQRTQVNIA